MKPCIKRYAILTAIFMIISGCGGKKAMISLDEAGNMTEEQLQQELAEFSREDIAAAWGEPAGALSGMDGEVFTLDEDRILIVYYGSDRQRVQNIKIDEISQEFEGVITEITGTSAVVKVDEGFPIRSSGDQVSIVLDENAASAQAGDRVRVTYNGAVMETSPLQLGNQLSIQLLEGEGPDLISEEMVGGSLNPSAGERGDMDGSFGNMGDVMKTPPVLQLQDALSSTYSKFEVAAGNYTWYCRTGNEDEMTGGIACGLSSLDEAREKERLKLPRYNKLDYVSYTVFWKEMPDRMTVKEYRAADSEDAEALSVTTYDDIFAVDLKPDRVYEITAEWKKETQDVKGFYGNAGYVVVTE